MKQKTDYVKTEIHATEQLQRSIKIARRNRESPEDK